MEHRPGYAWIDWFIIFAAAAALGGLMGLAATVQW